MIAYILFFQELKPTFSLINPTLQDKNKLVLYLKVSDCVLSVIVGSCGVTLNFAFGFFAPKFWKVGVTNKWYFVIL